jgi:wyosine [tRNA(Phe)-imidazoG37] synthetase (radical SAM superfamily)
MDHSASALGCRYLFGPVSSRRLGRSLGVDLLPYKTCSLDCVYCECGATTDLTTRIVRHVPTADVLAELDDFLDREPALDFITFAGSGEPTLHADLGELIAHLKRRHARYKVAVLSNGTLFGQAETRAAVRQADLLIPSLDGATTASFQKIDRPAPSIDVAAVIDGLVALRQEYTGTLVLEVFVVPGVNDCEQEVSALRAAALRIKPEAVQLNRLDRPGIFPWVRQASDELLARIQAQLQPLAVFAVKRRSLSKDRRVDDGQARTAILARLADRAFDTTTLAFLLGLPEGLVAEHVSQLLAEGRLARIPPDESATAGLPHRLLVRAVPEVAQMGGR